MDKEKQVDGMAEIIDEYTEPLSARDIHKAEFSEQLAEHLYNADFRKQSEVIEEYRKKVYSKMEKYTVFGREYIQRILREVEKEMVGDME